MQAAYDDLEPELARQPPGRNRQIDAARIATAVAWHFTERMLPGTIEGAAYPHLRALSAWAEQLAEFTAAPYGEGAVNRYGRA